jgi:hypothetical protein
MNDLRAVWFALACVRRDAGPTLAAIYIFNQL